MSQKESLFAGRSQKGFPRRLPEEPSTTGTLIPEIMGSGMSNDQLSRLG